MLYGVAVNVIEYSRKLHNSLMLRLLVVSHDLLRFFASPFLFELDITIA